MIDILSFGERLKKARLKKGMTQEFVAKKLGITFQALSNYERGLRDPDNELLRKMADLYNVTADYLLGRTEYRTFIDTQAAHVAEGPPIAEDALNKIEEIIKREREKLNQEKGN